MNLRRLAAYDLARTEVELRAAQRALRANRDDDGARERYRLAVKRHQAAERWAAELVTAGPPS